MIDKLLEEWGVKPTANRILVVKGLQDADSPLSLIELETALETMDRSSISRVLNLLKEKGMVHEMEDGRGISKYELCRSGHAHSSAEHHEGFHPDLHPHFFCEVCERVYCFDSLEVPHISTPKGFEVRTLNYMLKGVCPNCSGKRALSRSGDPGHGKFR